jgi:hypothetical protein
MLTLRLEDPQSNEIPDTLRASVLPLFEKAKEEVSVSVVSKIEKAPIMSANILSLGEFNIEEAIEELGESVAGRKQQFIDILNREK